MIVLPLWLKSQGRASPLDVRLLWSLPNPNPLTSNISPKVCDAVSSQAIGKKDYSKLRAEPFRLSLLSRFIRFPSEEEDSPPELISLADLLKPECVIRGLDSEDRCADGGGDCCWKVRVLATFIGAVLYIGAVGAP